MTGDELRAALIQLERLSREVLYWFSHGDVPVNIGYLSTPAQAWVRACQPELIRKLAAVALAAIESRQSTFSNESMLESVRAVGRLHDAVDALLSLEGSEEK